MSYRLITARNINDGIIRNFDYDAIITGTFMTENFKISDFNKNFNKKGIKVAFSGATYKEVNDNLKRAISYKKNIKTILRGLDYKSILDEPDGMAYTEYPEYLYDNIRLNDYKYIFNKETLIKGIGGSILYTLLKRKTTSFDEYCSFRNEGAVANLIAVCFKIS